MNAALPTLLKHQGRSLGYAGKGSAPGAHRYIDLSNNATHELRLCYVRHTGPAFAWTSVIGDTTPGGIKVYHHTLNGSGPSHVGDVLLVLAGPADVGGDRVALGVWGIAAPPAAMKPAPAPAPRIDPRRFDAGPRPVLGVVTVVKGPDWGFVRNSHTQADAFLHASQLRDGAALVVGQRVRYQENATPKGLAAFDVRPAW